MNVRLTVLACVGLLSLGACTAQASPSSPPQTASTSVGGTPDASPTSSAGRTPSATQTATSAPSKLPEVVVLSGTAIGTLPLGTAPAARVDPVISDRLGKVKAGQPELCHVDGERIALAVVEHTWPGFTVRYGSSGGAAVAMGWAVDLTNIPDGFQLDRHLPWQPTFASLKRLHGVDFGTEAGVQYAELTQERITYSAPVGAAKPDTIAGGPRLSCG